LGRQHLSQASLAARLIDAIALPATSRVVVAGELAFEARQVRQACARRGWSGVSPLNPERRLAGAKPRPKVRSLYEQLAAQDFGKASFRLDQGELAALARVSPKRSQSGKHERTYWVHHRTADILNIGEVALLSSTKDDPTAPGGPKVQRVLISNAVTASTQELLSWYSLRRQVELFFREMKSESGVCQYELGPFRRVVGWVNLRAVAYCYLGWYRLQKEREAAGEDAAYWRRLRTAGLKEQVRLRVRRADREEVLRLARTDEGQQLLKALLDRMGDDSAATAA
jgi:hypothetical protein